MESFLKLEEELTSEGWLLKDKDLKFGKVLGRGAAGITYEGDLQGQKVAVKAYSVSILKQDFVSVRNELTLLPTLKHPNIVGFVGICFKPDPLAAALVMDFAPNGDLTKAVHSSRYLNTKPHLKFQIAIGLAKAIEHLHKHDVIHRDIKPANVLLGADYQCLLTDFGFSRLIDTTGRMTGETGSYKYMAPEVVVHGPYSQKADTFSFAIVINEMFSGEHPYEHVLPLHAAMGVVKKNARPHQRKIKNERLKTIIQKCWDPDPNKRPEWPETIAELEAVEEEEANKPSSNFLSKLSTSRKK